MLRCDFLSHSFQHLEMSSFLDDSSRSFIMASHQCGNFFLVLKFSKVANAHGGSVVVSKKPATTCRKRSDQI